MQLTKDGMPEPESLKGLVVNIQDYSVHDGSGLRSIVFLKGCSLRCEWCQNPESFNLYPEIAYHERLCIGCDHCKEVCPEGAIIEREKGRVNHRRCSYCMKCIKVCPTSALTRVGSWLTVQQVLEKLRRYIPFYRRSQDGGITVSGGDPLVQPEFTSEVVRACRAEGIHTAIETCGYGDYEKLEKIADHLDLLLYDIKHIDDPAHKKGTKVGNKEILANLTTLCRERPALQKVIRIPLIPGYNDDVKTVRRIAEFVTSVGIEQIDLLPFNILPAGKYKMMGMGPWLYSGIKQQPKEKLDRLARVVKKMGLKFTVGGLW
jgi:pyruvate formate lyase activating enzyme